MRGDIPLKKSNKTIKVNSANKILKDKIEKKAKKTWVNSINPRLWI
jgi:hypothetical protein